MNRRRISISYAMEPCDESASSHLFKSSIDQPRPGTNIFSHQISKVFSLPIIIPLYGNTILRFSERRCFNTAFFGSQGMSVEGDHHENHGNNHEELEL